MQIKESPTQMRLKSLKCDLNGYLSQRIFNLLNTAMFEEFFNWLFKYVLAIYYLYFSIFLILFY